MKIEPVFEVTRTALAGEQLGYYLSGHSAGGQLAHRLLTFLPCARVFGANSHCTESSANGAPRASRRIWKPFCDHLARPSASPLEKALQYPVSRWNAARFMLQDSWVETLVGTTSPLPSALRGLKVAVRAMTGLLVVSANKTLVIDPVDFVAPRRFVLLSQRVRDSSIKGRLAAGGAAVVRAKLRGQEHMELHRAGETVACRPAPARATAPKMARPLFMVSSHSLKGTETWTILAPDWMCGGVVLDHGGSESDGPVSGFFTLGIPGSTPNLVID